MVDGPIIPSIYPAKEIKFIMSVISQRTRDYVGLGVIENNQPGNCIKGKNPKSISPLKLLQASAMSLQSRRIRKPLGPMTFPQDLPVASRTRLNYVL